MTLRGILECLGIVGRPKPDLIAELDRRLAGHAAEARKVGHSAEVRALMARTDPSRDEMKRLNGERLDAIDAAFRGRDNP